MAAQPQPPADVRVPRSAATGMARRVALVAPFGLRPKGTTSARILPIARVLASRGASVRVVIPPWDDPGRAGQRWREDGVEIVHTTARGAPFGAAQILRELLRETRGFAPDVVHCFKPIGYSGALAAILTASARRRGTPLIVVDSDDFEGPAGWSGRRRLGLAGAVRGAQEASTLRSAPLATVASQWLRQHLLELGRSPESILYLPNGHAVESRAVVHQKRELDRTGGCAPEPPTLLWYTRFTEAQPSRAADLIAAVLALVPAARLVVVGEEINAGDRAAAAAALAAAGVDERVDWRGYEPGAVERWLSASRGPVVAIYPLEDDPTNRARCPSKVPQLMALGIPVVAESVGEISSYLAAETECLVAPGDREGFAVRAARLLEDGRLRARVRKRLQAAAERWRWETVAGGLLDWYTRRLAPVC